MIEKKILRKLVLDVLKGTPETQINSVINDVERLVEKYDLSPSLEDCQKLGVDYRYYQQKNLNPLDRVQIAEVA